MPIYEYCCAGCNTTFEEWVKSFDSAPTVPCVECGAEAIRIVSNTSFMLKGGGWYVTEYAGRKSHGKETAAETSVNKQPEVASTSTQETKGVSEATTAASSEKAVSNAATAPSAASSASAASSSTSVAATA